MHNEKVNIDLLHGFNGYVTVTESSYMRTGRKLGVQVNTILNSTGTLGWVPSGKELLSVPLERVRTRWLLTSIGQQGLPEAHGQSIVLMSLVTWSERIKGS